MIPEVGLKGRDLGELDKKNEHAPKLGGLLTRSNPPSLINHKMLDGGDVVAQGCNYCGYGSSSRPMQQ